MTNNKILCSADEYAWMEDCLKSAQRAYEFATTKAKPNTALAASAPKHKASIDLFTKTLAMFAVRPGSVRSEKGQQLSAEFQKAFCEIPGTEVKTYSCYTPNLDREYTSCRPHNIEV